MITNLKWMRGINPQIIWLHSSNDLEILLVILLVIAFVLPTFACHKLYVMGRYGRAWVEYSSCEDDG